MKEKNDNKKKTTKTKTKKKVKKNWYSIVRHVGLGQMIQSVVHKIQEDCAVIRLVNKLW